MKNKRNITREEYYEMFPFTRQSMEEYSGTYCYPEYSVVPPFGSFCSVQPLGSTAFESAFAVLPNIKNHMGSSFNDPNYWAKCDSTHLQPGQSATIHAQGDKTSTTGGFINTSDKPNSKMWDGCPPPHSMAPDDEENIGILLKKLQARLDRELGKNHCLTYDFATNKWSYRTSLE